MKKDSRTLGKAWKKSGNGVSFPLNQLVKKRKNEHEW